MTTLPQPRYRLGVVVPSSNTVVEDRMRLLVAPDIGLHVARFRVVTISDDAASRAQFERDTMISAALTLADARVDHILWAGTAGSWLGEAHDRDFVDIVRDRCNLPASTAVTALRRRLAAIGATRIGLVTPYTADLEARIVDNFAKQGITVAASHRLDITVNTDFAAVSEPTLARMVAAVAADKPDAVVILCTNLAGAVVAREATQQLVIPVIDSVSVAFEGAVDALRSGPGDHRRSGTP